MDLDGELALGERKRGRPLVRYKDVCKRDTKACSIQLMSWEDSGSSGTVWKQLVAKGLKESELALLQLNSPATARGHKRSHARTVA
jgi:hypothetical protein